MSIEYGARLSENDLLSIELGQGDKDENIRALLDEVRECHARIDADQEEYDETCNRLADAKTISEELDNMLKPSTPDNPNGGEVEQFLNDLVVFGWNTFATEDDQLIALREAFDAMAGDDLTSYVAGLEEIADDNVGFPVRRWG
tara:strand:+ start:4395 stop:4826 length:432 start_codon:yes stop_codon:yes gene_type:complete